MMTYSRGRNRFPVNPLNAELNPICFLLALFGVYLILHVGRLRVKAQWVVICTARFNVKKKKLYIFPAERIYVFCVDLRTNSDYFPV